MTRPPRPLPAGLGPIERRAMELLAEGPLHVDVIAERLALPVGGLLGLLGGLELQELASPIQGAGWWEASPEHRHPQPR